MQAFLAYPYPNPLEVYPKRVVFFKGGKSTYEVASGVWDTLQRRDPPHADARLVCKLRPGSRVTVSQEWLVRVQ